MSSHLVVVTRRPFLAYMVGACEHPTVAALGYFEPTGLWSELAPISAAAWALAYFGDPED